MNDKKLEEFMELVLFGIVLICYLMVFFTGLIILILGINQQWMSIISGIVLIILSMFIKHKMDLIHDKVNKIKNANNKKNR